MIWKKMTINSIIFPMRTRARTTNCIRDGKLFIMNVMSPRFPIKCHQLFKIHPNLTENPKVTAQLSMHFMISCKKEIWSNVLECSCTFCVPNVMLKNWCHFSPCRPISVDTKSIFPHQDTIQFYKMDSIIINNKAIKVANIRT